MVLGHFWSRVNFFTVLCFIWNFRVSDQKQSIAKKAKYFFVKYVVRKVFFCNSALLRDLQIQRTLIFCHLLDEEMLV